MHKSMNCAPSLKHNLEQEYIRVRLAKVLALVPCSQLLEWVTNRNADASCMIMVQMIRCVPALPTRQVHTVKQSNRQSMTSGTHLLLSCKPCSFGNSCCCQSLSVCIAGAAFIAFCSVYSSGMSPLLHKVPDILLRCLQACNVIADQGPCNAVPSTRALQLPSATCAKYLYAGGQYTVRSKQLQCEPRRTLQLS